MISVVYSVVAAVCLAAVLLLLGTAAYRRLQWTRRVTTASEDESAVAETAEGEQSEIVPPTDGASPTSAGPPSLGAAAEIHIGPRPTPPDSTVIRTPGRSGRRAWLWSETTGREYLLLTDEVTIGRSADNDIVLDDPTVSRRHAVLRFDQHQWWLLPEVASNGTFRNGAVVQPGDQLPLGSGDVLRMGTDVELLLFAPVQDRLHFDVASRTTPGGQRRINEDSALATADTVAVADGVAGLPAGRIASRLAIATVAMTPTDIPLHQLVHAAHTEVRRQAVLNPPWTGMATTLDVARLVDHDEWAITGAHVGDGLVLLQRGDDVAPLTVADRLGTRLEARDPARAAALRSDPDYDLLTAGLGFDTPPQPQLWRVPAAVGQRLIMTTDGLLAVLPQAELIALLRRLHADPPELVANLLLELAYEGPDNVTVVVADVVDRERRPRTASPTGQLQSTEAPAISPVEFSHTDAETTGWDDL